MMNETILFKAGERKYIAFAAAPENPLETVVVTRATYEITNEDDGAAIESGDCIINDRKIAALVQFDTAGVYRFTAEVYIGAEKYKPSAVVRVR